MIVFVLLLLWSAASGIQFTQFEYHIAHVHVGETQFDAAVFIGTLDEDLMMNQVPISLLPLTTTIMPPLPDGGPRMPDAMLIQEGGMWLECMCANGNVCTYNSTFDPMDVANGPPQNLIPMPAVAESASVLFRIFANTLNPNDVVPLSNTLVAIKILDTEINVPTCKLHISDGFYEQSSDNSTVVGDVHSGTPAVYDPACTGAGLEQIMVDLQADLSQIADTSLGRTQMEAHTWSIAAHQLRDAWIGCTKLVNSLVTKGQVSKTWPGTKRCTHEFQSTAWTEDPCCNHALQFTQCCIARPVTGLVHTIDGVITTQVEARCQHPTFIHHVLKMHAQNQVNVKECESKAPSWEITQNLMRFIDICWEKVFGKNGPPVCRGDADCYTSCDQQRGECLVPYDQPDDAMLACFTDHIGPELDRRWRKEWGLTGQSSDAEFAAAFRANLFDDQCVGPTAWQFNDQWVSEPVANCDGISENCWCFATPIAAKRWQLTHLRHPRTRMLALEHPQHKIHAREGNMQCWHNYLQTGNQTACTADVSCNWSRNLNSTDCIAQAPASTFCAECHGGDCWPTTQPSMCATWFEDPAQCAATNGTQGTWGPQHCVYPNLYTEELCLPLELCGLRPNSTAANKEAALGMRWCDAVQRFFAPGLFETQARCEEGRCNLDPRLNTAECNSIASCNRQCFQCRPQEFERTLCFETTNMTDCAGFWNPEHEVCIHDEYQTAEMCPFEFAQCQGLDRVQCGDPAAHLGATAAAILQCKPNEYDRCTTQAACEAAGECNDHELQNWQNLNDPSSVCITPFNVTKGWPQCEDGKGWSRMGCLEWTVFTANDCSALGGVWHTKAFDPISCQNHGQGCNERRFHELTSKNADTCITCGGQMENYYKWSGGIWTTGQMRPQQWISPAMTPVNTWQSSLNYTKLWRQVEQAATGIMAHAIQASAMCKYNLVASSLKLIACDCGANAQTTCFDSIELVEIGRQEFFAGLENQSAEWANAAIQVPSNAIPVNDDSDFISASSSPGLDLLVSFASVARTPYAPYDSYEVVTNHIDYIVGRLVGNGVALDLPANLTEPINLCIDLDPEIPLDPESIYPVADFCGYNATIPKWWPLNLNLTSETASQYCADVNESGSYYPCRRLAAWEYATGVATTTTTTTTTTPPATTTTSTTTTTTTAVATTTIGSDSSGISAAAIVAIVLGGGVLVILVILILMYCTNPGTRGYRRVNTIASRYPQRQYRRRYH